MVARSWIVTRVIISYHSFQEAERRPEARKLTTQHFLHEPLSKLQRYPLLFERILRYSDDGHPDKENIPILTDEVRRVTDKMDQASGMATNRLRLNRLHRHLNGNNLDIKVSALLVKRWML